MKDVQQALEEELARLKKVAFEEALTVRWKPQSHSKISGEVVGETVYVYERDKQEAINTLKHEFLDYLITRKLVNPLVALVNTLIKIKEMEIYNEKERIVTTLSKLV